MLWLVWKSLRVIRNSTGGGASPEGDIGHGNDRFGAWGVVSGMGVEKDAAAVQGRWP
jgi:hypothetical protein